MIDVSYDGGIEESSRGGMGWGEGKRMDVTIEAASFVADRHSVEIRPMYST